MHKWIMVLVVVTLCGCGDEGSDPNCNIAGDSRPDNMGQFCCYVGKAYCERSVQCSAGMDFNACFNAFMAGCCSNNNTCESAVNSVSFGEMDACAAGMRSMTCDDAQQGKLPQSCL